MQELRLKAPVSVVADYFRVFVNRRAYVLQSNRPHPESARHCHYRPTDMKTGQGLSLTPDTIRRHLEGEITIGLYSISSATQCSKWVAIDAVSQGRMLFIATCNSIASLPPELRRRFTLGTFFFDLPTVDERLHEFKDKRGELVESFLSAYPRLCQETAGRLRTLYNPADYPPVDEVRSRFTFSWQYVSYGVPEQLREISAQFFQEEREKAVVAMSEACTEIQQVMRASLLELVNHLRDRLADQADGKPQRLRESTLQKLRDFLGTFDLRNVVDDQELKEQVQKANPT